MYIPTRWIDTAEVEKTVDAFIKTLGPEVVRVRYNIGEDWMGDPALYFRIVRRSSRRRQHVHRDGGANQGRFLRSTPTPRELGVVPPHQLSKQREQAQLNDPKWA